MSGTPALPPLTLSLPARGDHEEILDGDEVPVENLVRSLAAMAAVNRRLGGFRGIMRGLVDMAGHVGSHLEILDLGTGNGDLPRSLARGLARRGIGLDWVGMDLSRSVLEVALDLGGADPRPPRLFQADALAIPFRDGSFDAVISSLTLHHLSDAEAARLLEEAARVARHRVLVSDLERHPLHYAGARLLGATVWRRDPVTRIDGPLSVLRSFTRSELADLAGRGALRNVRIRRTLPFRLLIDGEPA